MKLVEEMNRPSGPATLIDSYLSGPQGRPVITIVSDLMKQLVRSGLEFMNPVETPFRVVENVGNSVGLGRPKASTISLNLSRASSKLSSIRAVGLLAVIKYFN